MWLPGTARQKEPSDSGVHRSTASPLWSDKLILQISPPGKKSLVLLHHGHMNRCNQPTAPLSASQKRRIKPSPTQKSHSQSNVTAQLKHTAESCRISFASFKKCGIETWAVIIDTPEELSPYSHTSLWLHLDLYFHPISMAAFGSLLPPHLQHLNTWKMKTQHFTGTTVKRVPQKGGKKGKMLVV